MEQIKQLHLDLPRYISELRASLHHFEIKRKIFQRFLRGKSFDFDGFRPYSIDDDAVSIDWKASVRANKLLVRQYREEVPMKIFFIVDVSEHMVFGSTEQLKCEYAASLVLSLADLIIRHNHKIGLVLFNEKITHYVPPQSGLLHFQRLVALLSDPQHYFGDSRFDVAFDFVLNIFDSSISAVILVSDFLTVHEPLRRSFGLLSDRFESIAIMVKDPLDISLPSVSGEVFLEDPIHGQRLLIDPVLAQKQYVAHAREQTSVVESIFREKDIDMVTLYTNTSFVPELAQFLKERVKNS